MVAVSKKIGVVCPNCEQPFELEHLPVREVIVVCSNCEIELEVISIDPLVLDLYCEEDCEERKSWDW